MLDMGFLPDIRRVLQHLPARRQTLFFSATMPPPIVALAREILRDPVTIAVERPAAPATGITHTAYPVASELKSRLLLGLLAQPGTRSVLAFTRTKHRANRLTEFLGRHGMRVERIHGNRSQAQRTQALAGFKSGFYQVLVATDIAARGIDIDALSHVVNFDVPPLPEDYIHRVGRTARAEARGDARHPRRAQRGRATSAPSSEPSGRESPGRRCRISTTTSGCPSAWRFRSPSVLPRSGPSARASVAEPGRATGGRWRRVGSRSGARRAAVD